MAAGTTRLKGGFPLGRKRYTNSRISALKGTAASFSQNPARNASTRLPVKVALFSAVSHKENSASPPQAKIRPMLTSWLRRKLRLWAMPHTRFKRHLQRLKDAVGGKHQQQDRNKLRRALLLQCQ